MCCVHHHPLDDARPLMEEKCERPHSERNHRPLATDRPEITDKPLHRDTLVGMTRATRNLFWVVRDQMHRFQRSHPYRILTNTTQPSHAIAVIVVLLVVVGLWPNLVTGVDDDNGSNDARRDAGPGCGVNALTQIAYLGSFTIHFGAQIWMTFVSGLALYFSLPRHTFGLIQEVLFPKYFTLGTTLSVTSLVSFVALRRSTRPELAVRNLVRWDASDRVQLVALALTATLELFVRLYLTPPMLRLMHEKHRIEAQASVGQEVGQFDGAGNRSLVRSHHYRTTHKKFRQIHMTIAILNMITLACTCLHLLYLAARVTI